MSVVETVCTWIARRLVGRAIMHEDGSLCLARSSLFGLPWRVRAVRAARVDKEVGEGRHRATRRRSISRSVDDTHTEREAQG
jgi:hypothetical protein